MAEGAFVLMHVPGSDRAVFEAPAAIVTVSWNSHEIQAARQRETPIPNPESRIPSPESRVPVDLSSYMTFRLLLGALSSGPRVHFANAAIVE